VVLHVVVGAAGEPLRDVGPLVAQLLVGLGHYALFILGPVCLVDRWI
jgi:hypothetical protein